MSSALPDSGTAARLRVRLLGGFAVLGAQQGGMTGVGPEAGSFSVYVAAFRVDSPIRPPKSRTGKLPKNGH